jgi:signal-transduction protein with cAMP-binding, CBS, and nucleotidyltransferase domain
MFQMLTNETNLFTGCSNADIDEISQVFKILSFTKGDQIIRKGEIVDLFAIVINGDLRVGPDQTLTYEMKERGRKIHMLGIGSIIGH